MPAYARQSIIEDEFGARHTPGGSILCGMCNRDVVDFSNNLAGTIYVCARYNICRASCFKSVATEKEVQ